jgi:hypothetical protein
MELSHLHDNGGEGGGTESDGLSMELSHLHDNGGEGGGTESDGSVGWWG